MEKGVVIYFSGTGNSKYVANKFAHEMSYNCYSIEDNVTFDEIIKNSDIVTLCHPIHFSSAPIIFVDFLKKYSIYLKSKKLIIFCTQQFFSGDGARSSVDYIENSNVIYAKHFNMPSNLVSMPVYSVLTKGNVEKAIIKADKEICKVVSDLKNNITKKQGFNKTSIKLGLVQRKDFYKRYKIRNVKARVSTDCILCNACVKKCPTKNLKKEKGKIVNNPSSYCTMCMRCVNICPSRAITVLHYYKPRFQYKCVTFK